MSFTSEELRLYFDQHNLTSRGLEAILTKNGVHVSSSKLRRWANSRYDDTMPENVYILMRYFVEGVII